MPSASLTFVPHPAFRIRHSMLDPSRRPPIIAVSARFVPPFENAMNVSYAWLRDYVETDLGYVEAARVLTQIGLNVEEIEDLPDGDGMLDVEVTSNRPDCLGHLGVARELAAACETRVTLPPAEIDEADEPVADAVAVRVDCPDLCPLYTARLVRGVTVGPSPE